MNNEHRHPTDAELWIMWAAAVTIVVAAVIALSY